MLITTTGIILRKIDYQNSSVIATVLTRKNGKIALLAKAAKKPRSQFSGKLHVGNIVEVVYYFKESRSVQIIKEISYAEKTFENQRQLEKVALTMMTAELVNQLVHEGESNEPVLIFLKNFLVWLNQTSLNPKYIFAYNQIKLADLMGIGLSLNLHSEVEPEQQPMYLNVQEGTISDMADSNNCYKLTPNQTFYIKKALKSHGVSILNCNFEKNEYKNLIRHLDTYFHYHFEGMRKRRSDAVFEQII